MRPENFTGMCGFPQRKKQKKQPLIFVPYAGHGRRCRIRVFLVKNKGGFYFKVETLDHPAGAFVCLAPPRHSSKLRDRADLATQVTVGREGTALIVHNPQPGENHGRPMAIAVDLDLGKQEEKE